MAFVSVDLDGSEWIYSDTPSKGDVCWHYGQNQVELPNGTIKKLISRDLTFDDEPVELT